ncbi:MAG: Spy/CpxP family protein refolding chaperone [Planctomycetota bacterium]|nr:Spy/CpxP family protein refolding chaperone [Planctomycetota bacterium]
MLFHALTDDYLRSDLGLAPEQEAGIAALLKKHQGIIRRIHDEATLQTGRENPGTADDGGPSRGQSEAAARATADAWRAAQPELDAVMKDCVAVLTPEQQTKLEALLRERGRLMAAGGNLWILTTEKAQQELGLSEEVQNKIRKALTDAAEGMDAVRKQAFADLQSIQAEQRAEVMRTRWQEVSKKQQEVSRQTRETVFGLLTADQKPRAEKVLADAAQRGRGGYGNLGGAPFFSGGANGVFISAPAGASVSPPAAPPKPQAPPSGAGPGGKVRGPDFRPPAALAYADSAARFRLVEDAGGPPPGASGPPPGMSGQLDGPPPWLGMMQNMISPEDQERIREMFRQGQSLRYLDDPDVRNDLKITPQQEKRIQELRERARGLVSAIGEDLRARFRDRTPPPDMTDEQRQAFMQEMAKAVAETVRGSLNEFEGMLGEANTLLTDEQKAMLKQIGPLRAQSDQLTGGLSYLTTSQAREEFAFTYDQAERIKMIVRDVEADAKKLRDEIAGPGKEPTPEELRGEKFAPFREGQKEMVKKALDRIMTILTGEQRDKVQKWAETRMGRTGRQGMRGRRSGPAAGQPGGGPEGPRPGDPPPSTGGRTGPEGRPPAPPPGGARAAPWQPPATLAVGEAPPRFRLAQDVSDGPPVEKPHKTEKVWKDTKYEYASILF